MLYRLKSDGSLKTQGEIRSLNLNTSFPKIWDAAVCNHLQIDPVLASPQPTPNDLQVVYLNGAIQDNNGNWVENWELRDKFSTYTNDEGVTVTKEEQETAYTQKIADDKASAIRTQRDKLLSDCDWTQVADAPVDKQVWATYRQALRDITSQETFPNSVTWPDKP